MSGHKPFSELTKHSSPERNARVEAETNRLLEEITLRELREALHIQQEDLGELLGIKQAAVSRMERRSDIHLAVAADLASAFGHRLIPSCAHVCNFKPSLPPLADLASAF